MHYRIVYTLKYNSMSCINNHETMISIIILLLTNDDKKCEL